MQVAPVPAERPGRDRAALPRRPDEQSRRPHVRHDGVLVCESGDCGLRLVLQERVDLVRRQVAHRSAEALAPIELAQPALERLLGACSGAGGRRRCARAGRAARRPCRRSAPRAAGARARRTRAPPCTSSCCVGRLDVDLLRERLLVLLVGDELLVQHAIEHVVLARAGRVRMLLRIVLGRPLRQAGEQRRLRDRQVLDVDVEERRARRPRRRRRRRRSRSGSGTDRGCRPW